MNLEIQLIVQDFAIEASLIENERKHFGKLYKLLRNQKQ